MTALATTNLPATFPGALNTELVGRLELPKDTPPTAFALFAHCFVCTKDINAAARIARGLAAAGIATLRFDFTGLGRSEGEFEQTTFATNVQDLVKAADWMRDNHEAPSLLVGHSLGGAAVLAAAKLIPESTAVATVGAPADPAHVKHLLEAHRAQIERDGKADVQLGGRPVTIGRQFLDDLEQHDPQNTISGLRRALLIFHAPEDTTVGIDNASTIYQWARHPKSFISLAGADHLLTDKHDADFVADTLATWAKRYIAPTNR